MSLLVLLLGATLIVAFLLTSLAMVTANHAKHAFYYVLILITLGFVTVGAGQVLFAIIEKFFPLAGQTYGYFGEWVLRFGLSSLLVAAPIYYFLTRQINRDLERKEIDPNSGIRRWLTYLIILIAAVTAIGDLIATFNSFLAGELTIRFALKALVILAIAGAVLTYYAFDLTRKDFHRGATLRVYNIGFVIAIIATFIGGILIATSPTTLRERQIDTSRISDLQAITNAVNQYYADEDSLPADLDALIESRDLFAEDATDPVTEESYTYRPTGGTTYELCATFATSATERQEGFYFGPEWSHEAGEVCFDREIDMWVLDELTRKNEAIRAQPVR